MRVAGIVILLVAAVSIPLFVSKYLVFEMTMILVYSIALLGLNILTGYSGQISFGHGAFYAVGAYTTAIMLNAGVAPYWSTIPAAAFFSFVAGFLFGLPALRLEGPYLGLATFALAATTPQLIKFPLFDSWTGGVQGLSIDAPPLPPFFQFLNADQWWYYQCLAITVVVFILGANLTRGRTGLALVAIREHSVAASTMGINTALYKTVTFGISAMFTGIAGALGALTTQFIAPDSFTVFLSISFLVGSVVGGVNSISGAVIGAIFIEFIPNISSEISKAAPWAIYGLFLIGFIFLAPQGVASLISGLIGNVRLSKRFKQRIT